MFKKMPVSGSDLRALSLSRKQAGQYKPDALAGQYRINGSPEARKDIWHTAIFRRCSLGANDTRIVCLTKRLRSPTR